MPATAAGGGAGPLTASRRCRSRVTAMLLCLALALLLLAGQGLAQADEAPGYVDVMMRYPPCTNAVFECPGGPGVRILAIQELAVDVLGCAWAMLEWYGPEVYDPLLACAGRVSCPFYIDPGWWEWDQEYCGWCPECERSLRVNMQCEVPPPPPPPPMPNPPPPPPPPSPKPPPPPPSPKPPP